MIGVNPGSNQPLRLLDILKPWALPDPLIDERADSAKLALVRVLAAAVEASAVSAVLRLVATPGKLTMLIGQEHQLSIGYLLSAPLSPCFKEPNKSKLLEVLRNRSIDTRSATDAVCWLDLLLLAFRGHDRFCEAVGREKFIATHPDLVEALWNITTSVPCQYRFLGELHARREVLIERGFPADRLICPAWLQPFIPPK